MKPSPTIEKAKCKLQQINNHALDQFNSAGALNEVPPHIPLGFSSAHRNCSHSYWHLDPWNPPLAAVLASFWRPNRQRFRHCIQERLQSLPREVGVGRGWLLAALYRRWLPLLDAARYLSEEWAAGFALSEMEVEASTVQIAEVCICFFLVVQTVTFFFFLRKDIK